MHYDNLGDFGDSTRGNDDARFLMSLPEYRPRHRVEWPKPRKNYHRKAWKLVKYLAPGVAKTVVAAVILYFLGFS